MPIGRRPNGNLRHLLAEARWTGRELAAAVNRAALESGLILGYDRRSVSHWLSGMRPREPAPGLIGEVLSRRLGRLVTVADADLAPPGARDREPDSLTDWEAETPVANELLMLWSSQGARGRTRSVYSVEALTVPGWSHTAAARWDRPLVLPGEPDDVGVEHARAAEALLALFHHDDIAIGGGHGRRALAAVLAVDLLPRLKTRMRPRLRSRMLRAMTNLTYLCGFMCFDDEQHGLAQRYYRAALRLAAENGDPTGYAVTLRGMSVQARILGHHREAVSLAEAALGAGRYGEPSRQAFLHGQLAVAHAAAQDSTGALAGLSTARRMLDRTTSTTVIGAYHPAALTHQQAAVLACLGDPRRAITALTESVRYRPASECRSRAVTLARLAELQLRQGRLEQAVGSWGEFCDLYAGLRSGRATTALRNLRARLRPHAHHPAVQPLLRRAAALSLPRRDPGYS